MRFCQCCATRPGETTETLIIGISVPVVRVPTVKVRAILCPTCRHEQDSGLLRPHTAGYCTICGRDGGVVWRCQRRDHFAKHHPALVEQMVRDTFEDVEKVPVPHIIGRVEVDARDADSPKRFY